MIDVGKKISWLCNGWYRFKTLLSLLVTNISSNKKHVNTRIKITCRGKVRNTEQIWKNFK